MCSFAAGVQVTKGQRSPSPNTTKEKRKFTNLNFKGLAMVSVQRNEKPRIVERAVVERCDSLRQVMNVLNL